MVYGQNNDNQKPVLNLTPPPVQNPNNWQINGAGGSNGAGGVGGFVQAQRDIWQSKDGKTSIYGQGQVAGTIGGPYRGVHGYGGGIGINHRW